MRARLAILISLLIATSSDALAEWVEVAADANATGYADRSTIGQGSGVVKMWELVDYKAAKTFKGNIKPVTFWSSISQVEYDCGAKKLRRVVQTFFSGSKGGGDPVYANPVPGEWVAIRANSNGEAMWKVACGKT